MQCPACKTVLHLTERQGIEIDYCPQCRGVWLDRGELDKLLERSFAAYPGAAYEGDRPFGERDDDDRHRPRRRKSFLSEFFDFD
ncbi:MAG: zf-TFIIB domain-containing protein [Candidatus Tectimicrobiota bacterium]